MLRQPKREEITNKLKEIIDGKTTREEVAGWAFEFIINDDNVEVSHIKAWHYLVSVSGVGEMIASEQYIYSIEDIKELIETSMKENF